MEVLLLRPMLHLGDAAVGDSVSYTVRSSPRNVSPRYNIGLMPTLSHLEERSGRCSKEEATIIKSH